MKHILLIVLVFTFLSCGKSSADQSSPDKAKPRLTIIGPTGKTFQTGDPLCFKGDVIDESSLNNVKLKLFRADNMNAPVIEYSFPVSDRSLYVEQQTIIPSSLNGNCVLQFEATDYYNNRAVATMNISCN